MTRPTLAMLSTLERDSIRDELPAYAWPGGYPLVYLTLAGDELCAPCATVEVDTLCNGDAIRDERDAPAYVDVYYEGPPLSCAECFAEIESAYGCPHDWTYERARFSGEPIRSCSSCGTRQAYYCDDLAEELEDV